MSPLARRRSAELGPGSPLSRPAIRSGSSGMAAAASPTPIRAAVRTTCGSTDHSISKVRSRSRSPSCPGRSQAMTQAGVSGASQIRAHSRRSGESSGTATSATRPGRLRSKSANTTVCCAARARSAQRAVDAW
jgi:hypothetical protein